MSMVWPTLGSRTANEQNSIWVDTLDLLATKQSNKSMCE